MHWAIYICRNFYKNIDEYNKKCAKNVFAY